MRRILLWMTVATTLLVSKSSAAAHSYVAEPFEWKKETKLGRLEDGDKTGQLRGSSAPSVAETKTIAPYGDTPLVAPSAADDGTFGAEHKTVTSVILPWEAVGSPHDSSTKTSSPTLKDHGVGASLKDGEVTKAVGTTNELQPHESMSPEVKNNDKSAVAQTPIDETIGLPTHTQQPTDPYSLGTNALHESETSVQQPIFRYSSRSIIDRTVSPSPSAWNDGKAPAGGTENASPYNAESDLSTTNPKISVAEHADGVAVSEMEEAKLYHDSSRHKEAESSEFNSNGRQHDAPGSPSEDKWALWGASIKNGPLKESVSSPASRVPIEEKQGKDSTATYSGKSESTKHERGVGGWEYESNKSPGTLADFVTSSAYGEITSGSNTQPKSLYDDESPASEKTYNPRHPDQKSSPNSRDVLQDETESDSLNAGNKNELYQRYSVGAGARNDGTSVEWQKSTNNKSGRQRRKPEAASGIDDNPTESAKSSHKEQVSTTYTEDGTAQVFSGQEQTASPYDDQSVGSNESSGKPLHSTIDGMHNANVIWANGDSEAPYHSRVAEPKLTHKSDGVGGKLDEGIANGYKNTGKGEAPEGSDSGLIDNKGSLKEQRSADKIEQSIQNSNPPYSPEVSSSEDEKIAFKEKAESYNNWAPPLDYDNRGRVFEPPGYDSTKTPEGDRHYRAEDKESIPNSVLGSVVPWSSAGPKLTNKYAMEKTSPTPSRIEPGVYSEVVDRTDTTTTNAPAYILRNTAQWNEHHPLFLRDLQSEDRAADGQPTEQPSVQSAENPNEQPSEPSSEKQNEQTGEQSSGHSSEQESKKPSEQSSGQSSEQMSEQSSEQAGEQQQPNGQSSEQSGEQSAEQPSSEESSNENEELMKTTVVEDKSVRWNQDDCHPCDVPTVPPTLPPLYPHNNDDYESHLPNVTEDSKPWEEVKENGSPSTKSPTKKKPKKPHRAEFVHCMKVIGDYGQYYECDNNSTETPATTTPTSTETSSPYEETTPEPTPTPTESDKPTPVPSEPTPISTEPYNEPTSTPPAPTMTTEPTPAPMKPSDEPTPTPSRPSVPTPAPTKPSEPTPAPTKPNDELTPSPTKSYNEPTPTPAASTTDGDTLATFTTDKKASTSVTTTPSTTTGATTSTTGATTGKTTTGTAETYTDSTTTGTTAGADKTEVTGVSTGDGDSGSTDLGGGAIAGIVIACVVFVVVVVAAVLFRQRSIARQREENLFADLSATDGRALETDYAAM